MIDYQKLLFQLDRILCSILRRIMHIKHYSVSWNYVYQRYLQRCYNEKKIYLDYDLVNEDSPNVWIFWAQGEENMPKVVKACYNSIVKNNPEKNIVLLDNKNFECYVDIPKHILLKYNKGIITITHFSDILRFSLLEKYGGWWIDATIFLNSSLPKPRGFFSISLKEDFDYISNAKWIGFFIYAPKNHPLAQFVNSYLSKYWEENNILDTYYLIDHIIRLYYDKCKTFRDEVNSLRNLCPDIYFFQRPECEAIFSQEKWICLKSQNLLFKLNWRLKYKEIVNSSLTLYGNLVLPEQ